MLVLSAAESALGALDKHIQPSDKIEYDQHVSNLRTRLGPANFAAAWAAGQAMPVEQAIAEARQITSSGQPAEAPNSPAAQNASALNPAGLTPRELEVLRLVAMGLGNQEIAQQLVLSRRTAYAHMRSIFSKLDVTTRTAAARVALENKLVCLCNLHFLFLT